MKVEEVFGEGTLITLEQLKKIVDEAHAKAPPGTKVAFRGDEWIPERIRGGLFATHVSTCEAGYFERMTDQEVEKRNQAEPDLRLFKLDVPVLLLSNREPTDEELAVSD